MINDDIIYPGYEYKRNKDNKIILPSIEEQRGKHTTECKKLWLFLLGASDDWGQPLLKKYLHLMKKLMVAVIIDVKI